jgi:N-acetylglucosamine-1-phosphate uridyltransferase (contains nucleotidyltransferase and I-patch acetyltransferase domains)
MSDIHIVVLAAGKGTRMNSARPKVLHHVAGRPMIDYVLTRSIAGASLDDSRCWASGRNLETGDGHDPWAHRCGSGTTARDGPCPDATADALDGRAAC